MEPLEFVGADMAGARFTDVNLAGAVIRESSLAGARLRGALLMEADIDGVITGLRINGVEVAPLVEAELDRRHPGRAVLGLIEAGR